VMQEDTRVEAAAPEKIQVLSSAEPGENVRLRGEDVAQGSTLLQAGQALGAGPIALLAATGVAHVAVGRRPSTGLLATGSELTVPGQSLKPGQIYESNRLALAALTSRTGAVPRSFPLVPDTLAGTSVAIAEALEQCDVVVTSGGVSVGEMDFLKAAFQQIGGELQFWKVAIKPGRPFVFGQHRGKLLFALPGNPVSALITFLLLVRPALRRWQGATDVSLPAHPGVLAEPLANPGARRHFMRVRVGPSGAVHSTGLQASHVLGSLAAANGLVDVPPDTTLAAGTRVRVLRWDL
jgi:molybdopterin molybdotransferase